MKWLWVIPAWLLILVAVVWLDVNLLINQGLVRILDGVSNASDKQAMMGAVVLALHKPALGIVNAMAFVLAALVHVKAFSERIYLPRHRE